MKSLITSALLLFATSAIASPNVGDLAAYKGYLHQYGLGFDSSQNIIQHNTGSDMFLVRQETQVEGQSKQVEENWTKRDNLIDRETAQMVVANCAQAGGVNETITVPAGQFNSCKLPINSLGITVNTGSGHGWIADVPFGIAKIDAVYDDTGRVVMELARGTFGE